MSQSSRTRVRVHWPFVLVLGLGIGCSHPTGVASDETSAASSPQPAPVLQDKAKPIDAGGGDSGTRDSEASNLPFHDENLPAGTLVTVRLKSPVLPANSVDQSSFQATVDAPVVINGNTLIPRGTVVVGRVESAEVSNTSNRRYVRLVLASIHTGGVDTPVQTASLFARPLASMQDSDSGIRLEQGRRLTFRFTQPVYIAPQRVQTKH